MPTIASISTTIRTYNCITLYKSTPTWSKTSCFESIPSLPNARTSSVRKNAHQRSQGLGGGQCIELAAESSGFHKNGGRCQVPRVVLKSQRAAPTVGNQRTKVSHSDRGSQKAWLPIVICWENIATLTVSLYNTCAAFLRRYDICTNLMMTSDSVWWILHDTSKNTYWKCWSVMRRVNDQASDAHFDAQLTELKDRREVVFCFAKVVDGIYERMVCFWFIHASCRIFKDIQCTWLPTPFLAQFRLRLFLNRQTGGVVSTLTPASCGV